MTRGWLAVLCTAQAAWRASCAQPPSVRAMRYSRQNGCKVCQKKGGQIVCNNPGVSEDFSPVEDLTATLEPGVRFVPEVQFNGSWYPICGAKMRENNNAADTICKQLGFSGGGAVVPMPSEWCTSTDTNGWRGTERPCYFRIDSFEVNASMMPIGKCGKGQPLHECDQGGNEWGNVDWQLPKPNYPVTPCSMDGRRRRYPYPNPRWDPSIALRTDVRRRRRETTGHECVVGKLNAVTIACRADEHAPVPTVRATGGTVVQRGVPFVPEVLIQGKWWKLCAKNFNEGTVGAVCYAAGFQQGGTFTITKDAAYISEDSLFIGPCGDDGRSFYKEFPLPEKKHWPGQRKCWPPRLDRCFHCRDDTWGDAWGSSPHDWNERQCYAVTEWSSWLGWCLGDVECEALLRSQRLDNHAGNVVVTCGPTLTPTAAPTAAPTRTPTPPRPGGPTNAPTPAPVECSNDAATCLESVGKDGGVVQLAARTYAWSKEVRLEEEKTVNVGYRATIIGQGAGKTVIDQQHGTAQSTTMISGLKGSGSYYGDGIQVSIRHLTIKNTGYPSVVQMDFPFTFHAVGCTFEQNRHGVVSGNAGFFFAADCDFNDNRGALFSAYYGTVHVTSSRFARNSQVFYGLSSQFMAHNCSFRDNGQVAVLKGTASGPARMVAQDCLFEKNRASGSGGVAQVEYGILECVRCTFLANSAAHRGGALHVQNCQRKRDGELTSVYVRDSTFVGNTAARAGAISVAHGGSDWCHNQRMFTGVFIVQDTTFENDTATDPHCGFDENQACGDIFEVQTGATKGRILFDNVKVTPRPGKIATYMIHARSMVMLRTKRPTRQYIWSADPEPAIDDEGWGHPNVTRLVSRCSASDELGPPAIFPGMQPCPGYSYPTNVFLAEAGTGISQLAYVSCSPCGWGTALVNFEDQAIDEVGSEPTRLDVAKNWVNRNGNAHTDVEGAGGLRNWACECGAGHQAVTPPTDTAGPRAEKYCRACPRGTYFPTVSTAEVKCLACEAGLFQDAGGRASCKPCPAGHFSTATGAAAASACTTCPMGRGGPPGTASEDGCAMCAPGRAGAGCMPCSKANEYQDQEGQIACKVCEPGAHRSSATSCTQCPPAYKCDGEKQTPCSGDGYQDKVGQSSCKACPPSSAYRPSRTVCISRTKCIAGRYTFNPGNATSDRTCAECNATGGHFTGRPNALSCSVCPLGKYSIGTDCLVCPPGSRCANGSQSACAKGTYSDRSGQALCKNCEAGRYQVLEGMAACNACDAGKAGGSVDRSTATHCSNCTAGTYSSAGSTACLACDTGRYQNASARAVCLACGEGKYQNTSGQAMCMDCEACPGGGRRSDCGPSFGGYCTPCPPGSFFNASGACVACPRGKYTSTSSQKQCDNCTRGMYQALAGQLSCRKHRDCHAGESIAMNGTRVNDRECRVCPPGSFFNASDACVACPRGKYTSTSSQKQCDNCTRGMYQALAGQLSCRKHRDCHAGESIATNGTRVNDRECRICADTGNDTSFSKTRNAPYCTSCTAHACPDNTPRNNCGGASEGYCGACSPGTQLRNRLCEACTAGRYSSVENAETCRKCPGGKYQRESKATFCESCGVGKSGDNARAKTSERLQCHVCSVGKVQPGVNSTSCIACATGHFQGKRGQVSCVKHTRCVPGEVEVAVPNSTADRSCMQCKPGRYSMNATRACEVCPPGKHQEKPGRPFCDSCEEGTVCASAGMTRASPCPEGRQCSSSKVEDTPCRELGKFANGRTGKCASCDDRMFTDLETNGCVGCPRGPGDSVLAGIDCKDGRIGIKPGYFVIGNDESGWARLGPELRVVPCQDQDGDACQTTILPGSMLVRTTCLRNMSGPLCAACASGHGRVASQCVPCPSHGTHTLMLLVFVLVAIVLTFLMTKKSLQDHLDVDTATVSVLRIGLNFLMMTGFLSQLRLDWGSVLRSIFNVAKAGSAGLPPLMECTGMGFSTEITLSLLLPLIVPLVPALMLLAWAVIGALRGMDVAQGRILGASKQRFMVNGSIAAAYLLWPALVVQVLRVLDCSVEVVSKRYVASDVTVQCFSGAHARLHMIAIVELVIVVPLLPACLWYRLRHFELGPGTPNREHLYFLYGGFRPGYEFWEAVVLVRKLLVLVVGVFLSTNTFGVQIAMVMWIMCGATMLQLVCQPYQNSTEQRLELMSLGVITFVCMLGQLILQAGEAGLGSSGLRACHGIATAVIAGALIAFFVFFTRELWRKAPVGSQRALAFLCACLQRPGAQAQSKQSKLALGAAKTSVIRGRTSSANGSVPAGTDTREEELKARAWRVYNPMHDAVSSASAHEISRDKQDEERKVEVADGTVTDGTGNDCDSTSARSLAKSPYSSTNSMKNVKL